MSAQELAGIIGSVAAFLAIAAGCTRWLIGHYFSKSAELEQLKETMTKRAIDGLQSVVMGMEHELKMIARRVEHAEGKITNAVVKIDAFEQSFGAMSEILRRVGDFIERPTESSEIRRVGKDLYVLKAKKRPEGDKIST